MAPSTWLFALVEFMGDNDASVAVVPRVWVRYFGSHGTKCFWPSQEYTSISFKQLVEEMDGPYGDWNLYNIKILARTDSYKEAEKRMEVSLNKTDCESKLDTSTPLKRKICTPSRLDMESNQEDLPTSCPRRKRRQVEQVQPLRACNNILESSRCSSKSTGYNADTPSNSHNEEERQQFIDTSTSMTSGSGNTASCPRPKQRRVVQVQIVRGCSNGLESSRCASKSTDYNTNTPLHSHDENERQQFIDASTSKTSRSVNTTSCPRIERPKVVQVQPVRACSNGLESSRCSSKATGYNAGTCSNSHNEEERQQFIDTSTSKTSGSVNTTSSRRFERPEVEQVQPVRACNNILESSRCASKSTDYNADTASCSHDANERQQFIDASTSKTPGSVNTTSCPRPKRPEVEQVQPVRACNNGLESSRCSSKSTGYNAGTPSNSHNENERQQFIDASTSMTSESGNTASCPTPKPREVEQVQPVRASSNGLESSTCAIKSTGYNAGTASYSRDEKERHQFIDAPTSKTSGSGNTSGCEILLSEKVNKILRMESARDTEIEKLRKMSKLMLTFTRAMHSHYDVSVPVGLPDIFPIANKEELDNLEDQVHKNPRIFDQMVSALANRGGDNLRNFVTRTMSKLLVNSFAEECNLFGLHGKIGLRNRVIFKAVCAAAKRNLSTKDTTQKQIEDKIRCWLTGSRDREGGHRQKEPPSKRRVLLEDCDRSSD